MMMITQKMMAFGLGALLLVASPLHAQVWPVPGVDPARDVPGAKEMPNPNIVHKVAFDMGSANPAGETVHPTLTTVARYINTLAKTGVPASNRKIAVVFHQGATDYVMNNEAYKARHEGQNNPNLPMIQALKKAGVDFRVCGQAVLGRKIDPKDITPEIELNLWALTTIIALQEQGYVFLGR